ncbi:MAG: glycosyl transferase [Frankiales bacterium]|nr:glycosyl transferase [Frankiales bacterium]
MTAAHSTIEVSVVLPCLDEARTVATCVQKASRALAELGVEHEVVVADNGSTDGSRELAAAAGARVVEVERRGYGAALAAGIADARGRYVLMADADDSYALDAVGPFVDALRSGNDLVMGNRFAGHIERGAMPPLHRYLGNPVLSFIGRLFFRIPVRDFHCGMRAFDRDKALALDLRASGMEFASELVVKFALAGHRLAEVPTDLRRDGRDRPPHLRSWRDGWRHLRFLLLFSPRWLFVYPGLLLSVVGLLLTARLVAGPLDVGGAVMDVQSLLFASAAVIVGVQALLFGVLSRTYAARRGMLPPSLRLQRVDHPQALEWGVITGVLLLVAGTTGAAVAVARWAQGDFGPLEVTEAMRLAIPSALCLSVGAEVLMASFFIGLLHLDAEIAPVPAPAGSPTAPDTVGPR